MVKKGLLAILILALLIPQISSAQGRGLFGWLGTFVGQQSQSGSGPAAALKFHLSWLGRPIPLNNLQNITPLNQKLWTPDQVLVDFENTRQSDQVGAIVFIKSEICHKNTFQPCHVTTAAFEKESTPLLDKFKIYGAWVRTNPQQQTAEWKEWEKKLEQAYGFKMGPGARVVVLIPDKDKYLMSASDAQSLNLLDKPFRRNGGRTPELERFLQGAIAQVPRQTPNQPPRLGGRPTLYTEPDHCERCRLLEARLRARYGDRWRNYINVRRGSPTGSVPYITDANSRQMNESQLFAYIDQARRKNSGQPPPARPQPQSPRSPPTAQPQLRPLSPRFQKFIEKELQTLAQQSLPTGTELKDVVIRADNRGNLVISGQVCDADSCRPTQITIPAREWGTDAGDEYVIKILNGEMAAPPGPELTSIPSPLPSRGLPDPSDAPKPTGGAIRPR